MDNLLLMIKKIIKDKFEQPILFFSQVGCHVNHTVHRSSIIVSNGVGNHPPCFAGPLGFFKKY